MSKKEEVQKQYPSVLRMVEDGCNITDAIKHLGLDTNTFYNNMTLKQKDELYRTKKLFTNYGIGSRSSF